MKKIIILFICFTALLNPVWGQKAVKIQYQGDIQVGYSLGIGALSYDRVNLHIINSVKIADYFSAGLGLGLDCYTGIEFPAGVYPELALPIYANVRGYLPVGAKITLFASMDIGTSIGLTEGLSGYSGLLFTPSLGVRFGLRGKQAISLGLGYALQKWSAGAITNFGVNTDGLQLKVGYSF